MKALNEAVAKIKNGMVSVVLTNDTNNEYQMTIEEYLEFAENLGLKTFFHSFIVNGAELTPFLLNNKYTSIPSQEKFSRKKRLFKRIDDDNGLIVRMEVRTNSKVIAFYDSKRLLNFNIEELKEAFEVDGTDLQVVAKCIAFMREQGHTKNSISACAFHDFMGQDKFKSSNYSNQTMFKRIFPTLEQPVEEFARRSYRGGWCYLKEEHKNKRGTKGFTYDVNSLFPYVMNEMPLPLYEPVEFYGEYEHDERYPLFIQEVIVDWMVLKPGKFPFLTSDFFFDKFLEDDYIVKATKPVRFVLTNVDLELLKECYEFGNIEYRKGYKFKASKVIFKEYIEKWGTLKKTSKGAKRQLAKLFLNSLYGRFALKNEFMDYIFTLDTKGVEKKEFVAEYKDDKMISYVPLASFITSYARAITIKAAIANYESFVYADTDSLHLTKEAVGIVVDDNELGAWKLEKEFDDSLFLGLKCYAEHDKDGWEFKIAGLPQDATEHLNIAQFYMGSKVNYQVSTKTATGSEVVVRQFEIGKKIMGKLKFKQDIKQ